MVNAVLNKVNGIVLWVCPVYVTVAILVINSFYTDYFEKSVIYLACFLLCSRSIRLLYSRKVKVKYEMYLLWLGVVSVVFSLLVLFGYVRVY